jgi:SAM-dependent methyltransferase
MPEDTGKFSEIDARAELLRQGLAPLAWKDSLAAIKAKLSPADMERFSRAHKNFVAYRSETTLTRFYDAVFTLGLHREVNGYRFARLAAVLTDALAEIPAGASLLDVGAGAGFVAAALLRLRAPRSYVVYDPVPAIRDELSAQGLSLLPHPPPHKPDSPFDVILCVDSLGEVNSDDDGMLLRPEGATPEELPGLLEQRYGFAHKLAAWKPYLAPEGRILLWEPFAYPEAFHAVARQLETSGWKAQVKSRAPGRNHLEIRLGP